MYRADSTGKRTVFKYTWLPSQIKMPFTIGAFLGHISSFSNITPSLTYYYLLILMHLHIVVITPVLLTIFFL